MKLEIPEHTLSCELDGQTILLNLDNGQYYRLNETGSILWDRLAAGESAAEAVEIIVGEY